MEEHWQKWTLKELEHQMSPSRWNPNKTADDVIHQYVNICSAETKKAREGVQCILDVSYGDSPNQKYDLYGTNLPSNAPVFMWIHGGYWQEGSKDISGHMALNMQRNGIKTLVLGYTLAPNASVEDIQSQFFVALRHAITSMNEAAFYIGGHSAGAQLAASILHCPNKNLEDLQLEKRIKGLVLVSGIYDLQPLVPTYVNDALKLTREQAVRLSPHLQTLNPRTPMSNVRIMMCVAEMDSPEFHMQSEKYYEKLRATFKDVQKWCGKGEDHFTVVEKLSESPQSQSGEFVQNLLQFILQ